MEHKVSVKEAVQGKMTIRVKVSGVAAYRLRTKIATLFFKAGAWLLFAKASIEVDGAN